MREKAKRELEDICLRNLKVENYEEVKEWYRKSHDGEYWINGLKEAVRLLLKDKKTPILICGDYDVDGDCSIAILCLMFKEAGFKNVRYRAPRRFSEGFGLNVSMIDEADEGIVITCDNGIAAIEAIQKAKDKGLTVIVTDHHMPVTENGNSIYPNADIIIDPNAIPHSAAFNGYCGAGICYKLAIEMLGKENPIIPKLEALAACATVADVMELREENHVIVKEGLDIMAHRKTTAGLSALLSEMKIEVPYADDIGYRIGPAINASGRLIDDGSLLPTELLMSEDEDFSKKRARFLHNVNERRKDLVNKGMAITEKIVEESHMKNDPFLVVNIPDVSEGIIGILAGQITEKYGVPSIVFTETDNGLLKGSGRSSTINLKETIDKVSELFVKYGGHAGAAGMTIRKENIDELRIRLINLAKGNKAKIQNAAEYDISIYLNEIEDALNILEEYSPFGQGNPAPVFKVTDFELESFGESTVKKVGEIGCKLISSGISAISFDSQLNKKIFDSQKELAESRIMEVTGTLSYSIFRGKTDPQIMMTDLTIKKDA